MLAVDGLSSLWQPVAGRPAANAEQVSYVSAAEISTYSLNSTSLKTLLQQAPLEFGQSARAAIPTLTLPTPAGLAQRFSIVESPIMEPGLAAQFPDIKTYEGQGIDDPAAIVRFDVTSQGFHAQVLSPQGDWYIDPYFHLDNSLYASYRAGAGDAQRLPAANDVLEADALPILSSLTPSDSATAARAGTQLRTYRLAVAATGEYTQFQGGTPAAAQGAIVTAVNRVTGIYQKELSIRLTLVANNNLLIYTDPATDPYTNGTASVLLTQNQANIDAVIGTANYDIGHVFATNSGGLAARGVGQAGIKAQAVTGSNTPIGDPFYVDYVAHEIGHQFGANHTFNGDSGSCTANWVSATAYEPGSGSTILSYAGICDNDNLQSNSDAYFHSASFDQIISYVDNTIPAVGTRTNNGNTEPVANAGADFKIPARTPFVLTASGSDVNGSDVLTYDWEERDLGVQRDVLAADNGTSPLFRSFPPTTSPTRVFPQLSDILNNTTTKGEQLPTTNRTMNFRASVRDNRAGGGVVDTDDMAITVVNTGVPFQVTAPNTAVNWTGVSTQTVTWNVAGTNANGINTSEVRILLSTDGGLTYPLVLAGNEPNDGSATITVPNISSATARLKVEAVGNIFFDVSNTNFTVAATSSFAYLGTSGDDVIQVVVDPAAGPAAQGEIYYYLNGALNKTIPLPGITWLTIDALGGNDTLTAHSLTNQTLTFIGGAGDDLLLTLGDLDSQLNAGNLIFDGGIGSDEMVLNDGADDTGNDSYTLVANTIKKNSSGTYSSTDVEKVSLTLNSFLNAVTVTNLDSPNGVGPLVAITNAGGADTIKVGTAGQAADFDGSLDISAISTTLQAASLTGIGTFIFHNSNITIPSALTSTAGALNGERIRLEASTLTGTGTLINQAKTVIGLSSVLDVAVQNKGTFELRNDVTLTKNFDNTATGILRVVGNSSAGNVKLVTPAPRLTQAGRLELTNDGLAAWGANLTISSGTFTNTGVIAALNPNGIGGPRQIDSDLIVSSAGDFEVAGGMELTIPLTNITLGSGTQFFGFGVFHISGVSTLTLPSDLTLESNSIDFQFDDLTGAGAGKVINKGLLTLANDTVKFKLHNIGEIYAQGFATIESTLTTAATSTISVQGNSTFGGAQLDVTLGFTNLGNIRLANDGSAAWSATLKMLGNSTLVNTGAIGVITGGNGGGRIIEGNLDSKAGTLAMGGIYPLVILNGTATLGSGTIFAGDGIFNIAGTSTLNLLTDLTIPVGVDFQFDTLAASGGAKVINLGLLTLANDTVNYNLHNVGEILAKGTNSISSTLTTAAGSKITIQGNSSFGNAQMDVAVGFTNLGTIELTNDDSAGWGATLKMLGTSTLTNTAIITAIPGGGGGGRTIEGNLDSKAGTLALVEGFPLVISNATATLGSGTHFTGAGIFYIAGTSTLNLPSDLTIPVSVDFQFDILASSGIGKVINQGLLTLDNDTVNFKLHNTGEILARGTSTIVSTLTTAETSTMTVQGTGTFGSAELDIALALTNLGQIFLANEGGSFPATLKMLGTSKLTNSSSGLIATANEINQFALHATEINNQGRIQGLIDFTGHLINSGVLAPDISVRALILHGDLTQTATGALNIELGASSNPVQFDGSVALAGTLNVTAAPGFVPPIGAQATILISGQITGDFSTKNTNVSPGIVLVTSTDGLSYLLTAAALAPEVEVLAGVDNVPDNSGSIAFGSVQIGAAAVTKTVTVKNIGTIPLSLETATLTGSGFTIVTNLPTSLAAGAQTSLVVRLDATVAGVKSASLSFVNGDANESPFNFALTGTVTEPEAEVFNGTVVVADNTGIVNLGTAVQGAVLTKTITVKNTGTAPLTLQAATLVGSGFSIVTNLPTSLAAGASASLVVKLDTALAGAKSATISFANNDVTENPYNFTLQGAVTAPEADVLDGTVVVADNTGIVNLGTAVQGAVVTRTITVKNTGTAPLTLQAATLVGAGFSIVTNLPTSLAAGASASLVVKLDTALAGAKSATISFANNDVTENPYNFTLQGTVTAPEAEVFNGTVVVADNTGIVNLGTAVQGAVLTKTITVKNTGTAPLTLQAATLVGAGFSIVTNLPASLAAGASASLVVKLDTALAGAKSATISFANNDVTENPYNFTLQGTVTAPEAEVFNGTVVVADNTGIVNLGTAVQGAVLTKTITVKNTGTAPLTLQAATLVGAGFSIVTNLPASLAAGASASLVVKLDTALAGAKSATISFANNDVTENPYNFTLQGTVTAPEAEVFNGTVVVADNTGIVNLGTAVQGAVLTKTITVKNTGTAPLTLQAATLVGAGFSIVTNLPASLAAGASASLVVKLDTALAGAKSATLSFANNDVTENPYNFTLQGTVTAPEADVLDGTVVVADNTGIVNLGTAVQGAVVTRTITVKNTGTAPLTLQAATLVGAGFSIVTNLPTSLAAGASASLVVKLDTALAGAKSATISFANNDVTENPYNFTLQGTVTAPEAEVFNGTVVVADNTGIVNLGTAVQGAVLTKTITVKNTGTAPLTLQAATLVGAGFSIVTNLPASLAAGASASLVVKLDTALAGAKSATLSFANNDVTENPYNFTLQGTVTAPEADVLDGTVVVADNTGIVNLGTAVQGAVVTRTITVKNTGTAPLTLQAATLVGAGFSIVTNLPASLAAGASASLVVKLDTALAGAKSATLSFANNDVTENPYNFTLQGTVTAPEADVLDGTVVVADNTGIVNLGTAVQGAVVTRTITVKNTGTAPLTLQAATLVGAGFSIVTNLPASLAAGASASLVVKLDTALAGAKSATISFANNDVTENPYNFTLQGTVTAP